MVRTIYGGSNVQLEGKLQTSLKIEDRKTRIPAAVQEEDEERAETNGRPGPSRSSNPRRSSRRAAAEEEEEEEAEEEHEEDED